MNNQSTITFNLGKLKVISYLDRMRSYEFKPALNRIIQRQLDGFRKIDYKRLQAIWKRYNVEQQAFFIEQWTLLINSIGDDFDIRLQWFVRLYSDTPIRRQYAKKSPVKKAYDYVTVQVDGITVLTSDGYYPKQYKTKLFKKNYYRVGKPFYNALEKYYGIVLNPDTVIDASQTMQTIDTEKRVVITLH